MPRYVVMFPADNEAEWEAGDEADHQAVYDTDTEFVRLLEWRIDEDQATALLRRHVGVERRVTVDRDRLGASVTAQPRHQRANGVRFALARDQAAVEQRADQIHRLFVRRDGGEHDDGIGVWHGEAI